jgi:hypothetical protein
MSANLRVRNLCNDGMGDCNGYFYQQKIIMKKNINIPEPQTEEEVIDLAKLAAIAGILDMGQIVFTPSIRDNFRQTFIILCLTRHRLGDWGEVDEEDWECNDEALRKGSRILSAYFAPNGEKLWVITEWDRQLTTVLMPDEY